MAGLERRPSPMAIIECDGQDIDNLDKGGNRGCEIMKVETEVSAFVVRKDMVIPYKTLETAATEADEYDFMRICNGHYICKHKDTAYRITIDGDKIGCSCPAMTFHCKGNDVCKHLAVFNKRRDAPQKQITADIAMELIKAGWTGEPGNMTPPDVADAEHEALIDSAANAGWSKEHPETTSDEDGDDNGGGDPVPPEAEKPEPPEKITVTCQYCMKRATRNSQAEADAWLDSHPCKDRPRQKKQADSEPPLGAKVYSRTCPHCDERFDGTDLDEVKDRHREHIGLCPENPANKPKQTSDEETVFECQYCGSKSRYQATIESHEAICPKNPANKQEQQPVGSKTEPTETPSEQKPIVKESLTPKTQPEQEEETKMEEETTTPETAIAETPMNTADQKPHGNPTTDKPKKSTRVFDDIEDLIEFGVGQIFGDTGTGKTAFCRELAEKAADAGKKVVYWDSEGNMTRKQRAAMAEHKNIEYILDRDWEDIRHMLPVTGEDNRTGQSIYSKTPKLKKCDLFILDSIGVPVLGIYGDLKQNQKGEALQGMQGLVYRLGAWAEKNDAVVIITNQPTSEMNKTKEQIAQGSPFGDKAKYFTKEILKITIGERSEYKTVCHLLAWRSRSRGRGAMLGKVTISDKGTEIEFGG